MGSDAYTYEINGWNVDYSNRDLICKKDNSILVIQCKKWSKRKNIEKDCISQLINAIETYKNKKCFQDKEVKGILYTTTNLSDSAMQLAQEKHIEIKANFPLDKNFPCIKCKNEENGKSYYYLPFNKQYFDIKLDLKNKDCYCNTVQEAESKNFTYIGG